MTEKSPSPPARVTPDDLLPPVEPPSARFLIQLFVVPGVIVASIVAVWLLFSWIAHRASAQPESVIQGLKGSGAARWQRASELADMLRSDRYKEFRESSTSASQLAEILDREIDTATTGGGMETEALSLRYFLCRALGEFKVTEGMDVLLKAATTERDPREQWVRRGAIQAIAVRAFRQQLGQQQHEQRSKDFDQQAVESTMIELAGDEDPLIRSETAFALGRLGTPDAMQQLEIMLHDPHTDTRYNAAVGLAQHGNLRARETLVEMLDPEETVSIREEPDRPSQVIKRAVIMKNAMEGVMQLVEAHPNADFSQVSEVLQQIVDLDAAQMQEARVDPLVAAEAQRTLEYLAMPNQHTAGPSGAPND